LNLDKYARDAPAWASWATINYQASMVLFQTGGPYHFFPAATLAHHALEMYLKAALINGGMTVFDPKKVKRLNQGISLTEADCAWGHELSGLAKQLAVRNPDFDLSFEIDSPMLTLIMPIPLLAALEHFDPYFSELRYPQEINKLDGIGTEDSWLFARLVEHLEPFSNKLP
jgi:hypothetical protein